MRIDHVGIWTDDLERLSTFYKNYFGARVGALYENPARQFESRFLEFESGARIEIMKTGAFEPDALQAGRQRMGLAHLAISLGSESRVDELTKRLMDDGHPVVDGPRRTGDGYYESVILDPDGNRIEVTV